MCFKVVYIACTRLNAFMPGVRCCSRPIKNQAHLKGFVSQDYILASIATVLSSKRSVL